MAPFDHCIATMDELRALIPPPDPPAANKDIDHVDVHCRAFIARSPFVVIASAGADGTCDASPNAAQRLEEAGFRQVYDYEGGVQAWREAGERVEGRPEAGVGRS